MAVSACERLLRLGLRLLIRFRIVDAGLGRGDDRVHSLLQLRLSGLLRFGGRFFRGTHDADEGKTYEERHNGRDEIPMRSGHRRIPHTWLDGSNGRSRIIKPVARKATVATPFFTRQSAIDSGLDWQFANSPSLASIDPAFSEVCADLPPAQAGGSTQCSQRAAAIHRQTDAGDKVVFQ